MKERLPLWLQALLLVAVSTVPPAMYWWLCKAEERLRVHAPDSSYHVISYMALPVVYLGFSFCYRVVRTKNRKTVSAAAFLSVGLAFTVVAIYMFFWFSFFPPVQRVRDGSGLWSSASGSGVQEFATLIAAVSKSSKAATHAALQKSH